MFNDLVAQYATLLGIAGLITFIINALKFFKVIPDGLAPTISGGANLAVLLIMYGFKLLKPEFDFATLDPIAMEIATVANFILQYLMTIGFSKVAHASARNIPIIGFSYSSQARASGVYF